MDVKMSSTPHMCMPASPVIKQAYKSEWWLLIAALESPRRHIEASGVVVVNHGHS